MFIVKFCFLVRDLREIKITMIEHTCKSLINYRKTKKKKTKRKKKKTYFGRVIHKTLILALWKMETGVKQFKVILCYTVILG